MNENISLIITVAALSLAAVSLYKKFKARTGAGETKNKKIDGFGDSEGDDYEPYKKT
ncbi:MAG: hypothetical protein GYA43_06835 [Bacteroidales bacterium]|nr:hypothetical protein [Bacteroidales bacterium]